MAELIFDELIEENFTSRGNGVFELNGARDYRFAFSSTKRANGDPAEAGDLFPCTFAAAPNIVMSTIAVYTPGSPALLDATGGPYYKTSALGGGLPDFGTKDGIVGLSLNAALLFVKDLAGGIANPGAMRVTAIPPTLKAFKAFAAAVNGEGVAAQCGTNNDNWSQDFLGGLIGADADETDAADEEDIFASATAGLKLVRRSIKAWRTVRNKPIDAGQILAVLTADKPNALYGVHVQDRTTKTSYAAGEFRGDAATVVPVRAFESGGLEFDISGTSIRVRNTTGGAINVDYTRGRIA
ncbi:MAG: hypothetical protein AB7P23_09710 [Amphiplicatus sp.]